MTFTLPPLSLYIHIPWCIQKCPYCDFNSHAAKGLLPEQRYVQALLADLQRDIVLFNINRPISSIFIGGGTPSLFSPEAIAVLLAEIRNLVAVAPTAEITLEANPGTFESQKFAEFRALGINRLSIGIQSFDDRHLKKLGRIHNAGQAFSAVDMAKQAGFDNFNLDLMFGLPDQTIAESLVDIQSAITLNPTHLSFYQLTLEPNTYFHRFPPTLPTDELIFAAQQGCQQLLAAHGFVQYEVSAYSQEGARCNHNLNYWQFGDYLGIGAGAHGKISQSLPDNIIRTVKHKHPELYLSANNNLSQTRIEKNELPLEFVMNHLRLRQGFSLTDYDAKTKLAANTLEPALSEAIAEGLLLNEGRRYYCSEKGWNFLDIILEKFI
jgi:putative oxygen-independent coproporphyrinogen III oxidase